MSLPCLIILLTRSSNNGEKTDSVKKEEENKDLLLHSSRASTLRWGTTPTFLRRWLQGQTYRRWLAAGIGWCLADANQLSHGLSQTQKQLYNSLVSKIPQPEWLLACEEGESRGWVLGLGSGRALGVPRFTRMRHSEDGRARKRNYSFRGR